MKPKERFYGYAVLPTQCDRNQSVIKDDIPIDLSTKRQHSPSIVRSISSFASSDFEPHSIDPTLGYNDWSTKFLLSAGTRNMQIQTNPNLLPYLLLNRNCLDVSSSVNDAPIPPKSPKTDIIYDQFGHPYRVGADHSLISLRSPYFELYKNNAFNRTAQNGSHISSPPNTSSSNSSSPSTNSTNNSHEYNETKRLLERSPTNSSLSATPEALKTNRSHNHLSNRRNASQNLIRSRSFPSIISALKTSKDKKDGNKSDDQNADTSSSLSKSRSESSLHYLTFERYERKVSYKPKSLAIFRYSNGENIERIAEKIRKNQEKLDYKHCLKRNENPLTMDSDIEKEDIIESGVSDDYGSDDALDLRVSQSLPTKFRPDLSHTDPEHLFHQINNFLNQSTPAANPLDVYRQYYYYLMNQPALASRAVAAVAVAETYAKLLSGGHHNHRSDRIDDHNSIDICDTNTSLYESENQSPDYLLNGSRAELRSADTTNNGIPFDRKRISRPLTGKHVRHGTGASPSTLVSLRNMIQQRQRLKDIGALDANKYSRGKAGKRVKRK